MRPALAQVAGAGLLWALGASLAGAADADSYDTTKTLPPLHHAVGIPLPEGWKAPERLSLEKDRILRCPTCHGLKDIDKTPFKKIDPRAEGFLRAGPYPKLETFCYNCHVKDQYERPNIHIMRDENGRLLEEHCTFCHEEVHKERDTPRNPGDFKLRQPPEVLCFGCHLRTPHLNAREHQAVKIEDSRIEKRFGARMKRRIEAAEKKHGVLLPLSAAGKVMCPTCHSPHPPGVIDAARNPAGRQVDNADLKTGVRYREHPWRDVVRADKKERLDDWRARSGMPVTVDYGRIDREVLLRLPARDGTLCLACHEFDD